VERDPLAACADDGTDNPGRGVDFAHGAATYRGAAATGDVQVAVLVDRQAPRIADLRRGGGPAVAGLTADSVTGNGRDDPCRQVAARARVVQVVGDIGVAAVPREPERLVEAGGGSRSSVTAILHAGIQPPGDDRDDAGRRIDFADHVGVSLA